VTQDLPWGGLDGAGEELVVRVAERRDAPRFLDHMGAIVSETDQLLQCEADGLPDVMTQRALLAQFDRLDNCLCIIAHRRGDPPGRAEILGSLTLLGGMTEPTRHVSKLGMGVRRSAWRCGIGRRLVQLALQWAECSEAVERITLQVYASNHGALTLYRETGFEEDGLLVGEVRLDRGLEDLVTMGRSTS